MKKIFFLLLFICTTKNFYAQNVGIGTPAPYRAKLQVNGTVGTTSTIFSNGGTGISIQRSLPSIGFNQYKNNGNKYIGNGFAAVQYLDTVNGNLIYDMFPNGTMNATIPSFNRGLIISSNGNVGIRTNPTNATLFVVKAGNVNGSAVFGGTNYNSHFDYDVTEDIYIRGGKSGSKVIINDISGGRIVMGNGSSLVSINNGIPSYPLEIREVSGRGVILVEPDNSFNNWEMRAGLGFPESPGPDLFMVYNGQYKSAFEHGTGYPYTFSDRRLKTNIRDMASILEKYMLLQPVEYEMKYNNASHKKMMGFIAQDVQKLFPQLVTVTTNTRHGYPGIDGLYGLNYNGLRILTIKALQQQQEKIKNMQEQNVELTKRIAAAEKLLVENK